MPATKTKLNCALIQTDIIWEDPEKNLAHFEIEILKLTNCDLIILPELFSTGFSMNITYAEPMDGNTVNWMLAVAKKHQTNLMGSVMILEGSKVYNRMVLAEANGNIQYYDKRHLFGMGNENKHFTRGTTTEIFDFKGWKIKPIICYDLRFPVTARNVEDYDVLICVANWPHTRIDAWDTLLKARAIENQCYVFGVNRVGVDASDLNYIGHSNVYNPMGVRLLEVSEETAVLNLTIDKKEIELVREQLPFLEDRDEFELV